VNPHPAARGVPPPVPAADPDGVLLVDKPCGPTSHDIVAAVRRRFRLRKVGHGGTLDPQATGLLVLLVGRATKLSGRFLGSDKTYEGVLRLGVSTDSHDAQGQVVRTADPSAVTAASLAAEMERRVGDQQQTPPMVSAVKVEGVPLYKRARKGQTVEREARLVHIYEFRLLTFEPPLARFRVRCSKGTYVRTLVADAGDTLGCGASLDALRRLESGPLRIEEALPLDTILAWDRAGLERSLLPLRRFL
jgi:tRNA pseudouridine55 synthase